jgi:hypothetical protein
MKKIIFLLSSLIFIISCSGIKDAGKILRNEKEVTTDEFLIKKKAPLILPPNYEIIPEPGSISKVQEKEEEKIQKILKAPTTDGISENNSSSIEDSILNRIRK